MGKCIVSRLTFYVRFALFAASNATATAIAALECMHGSCATLKYMFIPFALSRTNARTQRMLCIKFFHCLVDLLLNRITKHTNPLAVSTAFVVYKMNVFHVRFIHYVWYRIHFGMLNGLTTTIAAAVAARKAKKKHSRVKCQQQPCYCRKSDLSKMVYSVSIQNMCHGLLLLLLLRWLIDWNAASITWNMN